MAANVGMASARPAQIRVRSLTRAHTGRDTRLTMFANVATCVRFP